MKVLIDIEPNGELRNKLLTYVNNLYPGFTLDKDTSKKSRICRQLKPNEQILADSVSFIISLSLCRSKFKHCICPISLPSLLHLR